MSELPFILHKDHKRNTRKRWTRIGMNFRDYGHFEFVYYEYIHATNCELCDKTFIKSIDRQLDHNHETGYIRNILCNRCNSVKKDAKRDGSNTGEEHIYKFKDKSYKSGFVFRIKIMRDRKTIICASRTTLELAIICRDEFIKNNPEIYT